MKHSALIRRVALALLTAFGLLASSPTEASVSRDSSFKANPFAALPQLTSKPIAERLAAVDQNDAGCAALCDLAASIDSDPLGYGTKPHPFDVRPTPFGRQYFYANDNPTMFVDPTGYEILSAGCYTGGACGAPSSTGGVTEPEKQVGAFSLGGAEALWDAGVGAVGAAFKVGEIGAKLNYGTMEQKADALRQLREGARGAAIEVKERLSLTSQGLSDPGQLLDACAELGSSGCAKQIARSVVEIDMALAGAKGTLDMARKGLRVARGRTGMPTDPYSPDGARYTDNSNAMRFGPGPQAVRSSAVGIASGDVRFKRWKRGEAIDKPLPSGDSPSWDVVRGRYWKNRYEASKSSGEFSAANLERMRRGGAPVDYNPRTSVFEERELHHVVGQQYGGPNSPLNLRELTPDWHAEVDPFRIREGVSTTRGIR